MPKIQPELGPGECNGATGCKLIMIEIQWFNNLVRQGHIKAISKNRYRVIDVVQGYITYLRDENRRAAKSASASRVQDARAEQIAFQMEKERRDVIPKDEVCDFLTEAVGTFRSRLSGVPAACTRDPELRKIIEGQLDDTIADLEHTFSGAESNARGGRPLVMEAEEASA